MFLDDLGVNVRSAREVGMITVRVRESEKALGELEALLGVRLVEGGDCGSEGSGRSLTENSELDRRYRSRSKL